MFGKGYFLFLWLAFDVVFCGGRITKMFLKKSKKWDVVWEYLVGALQAQRRTRQQLSRVAHSKLSVLSAAVEIQVRMEERASDLLQ